MSIDFMGFLAGILTSVNLIPQIYQSIKTRKVDDISMVMFLIYDLGLILWVVYGVLIKSIPIVTMDGFALLCSLVMTYIKVQYKQK